MAEKTLFYELSYDQLEMWLADQGEPAYRAGQICEWAYQRGASSFDEMTNLSKSVREVLAANFTIGPAEPIETNADKEAEKMLLPMPGGAEVECVRMGMGSYASACLSTQVGCSMRCAFCATGMGGCERNLTVGEIVLQLVTMRARTGDIRNVVYMGMGEAFHNYQAVVDSINRITDKREMGLSPGRITVSTAGVVPAIHRYAKEGPHTELTVSLNASDQATRDRLMPGVSRWDLGDLLSACAAFTESRSGQPVTFAYVLLEGINDTFEDAERLAKLLRPQPHHLNLIPYNKIPGKDFISPNPFRVDTFYKACCKQGLNTSVRHSKGRRIAAACGQLRRRAQESD